MTLNDVPRNLEDAATWIFHHRCPNQHPKGVFCGGHLTRDGSDLSCDTCGCGWSVEQGEQRTIVQRVPLVDYANAWSRWEWEQ